MRALTGAAAALIAAVAIPAPAAAQLPPADFEVQAEAGSVDAPREDLFIRGLDSVWTAAGTVLEDASILIRDGRIAAIGSDVSAPGDVETIDGRGMTAIPGLVDEHSHTAMDRGTNESAAPVVPEVRVLDALDHEDLDIYRALSGGVTTSLILHGSSNPIGGQGAVIKMRWGMERSDQLLVEEAPRIVKFALGENVTRKRAGIRGHDRFPASREGVEQVYVEAFTAAEKYRDAWRRYREDPGDFRVPPRRDLRLEALVDIMEGRVRVHAHSYRSDEIVMLMRVAERFGFTIDVFTHVLEGYKVADEMAAHGAGGSTFSDWWAYKLEAYDAIPYNAAIMHEHGVLTSVNSDIPWLQSFMVYEFNKPVKYGGVSKAEALRMLTLYPAQQLRIDHRVGTLEEGKDGDVVLLSGDPFDAYSRVEKTIVDGHVYFDLSRDEELRGDPVRALPEAPEGRVTPDVTEASGSDDDGARSPGAGARVPAGDGGAAQAPTVALTGATVHPVSGPAIADGVVVIRDGRIAAVGREGVVGVPADARTIDLSGKHLYPGMIDPMTTVGMVEIGAVAAARDDWEVGPYNPHVRALTGIHPHSDVIGVTRANGITSVLSVQGSGIIRGTGSVVQLAGDTPERMAVEDRAALVVDLPSPEGEEWEEASLEGDEIEEVVELFRRARLYARRATVDEDPTAPFGPNARPGDEVLLRAMVPAMRGEMPVFFSAREEREIRTLLLFLDEFPDLDAVLVGADQAARVAGELAAREIPVVLGDLLRPTRDRDDRIDADWRAPGILHRAGVTVSFTTMDDSNARNLPYHAAWAVAHGLPRETALRGVTLTNAEILGLADEMGSIEEGKRADLIVTDGDPLQIVTTVERIFIAGREVPPESRHTRLYDEFRERH